MGLYLIVLSDKSDGFCQGFLIQRRVVELCDCPFTSLSKELSNSLLILSKELKEWLRNENKTGGMKQQEKLLTQHVQKTPRGVHVVYTGLRLFLFKFMNLNPSPCVFN